MKKTNLFKLLDIASESAKKLIDNPSKENANECDRTTEIAQQELNKLIKEISK